MRKYGVFIKTFLLLLIIVLVIMWMILGLGWYIFRYDNLGTVFLISLIVAVVVTFIMLVIMLKKEKNSPVASLHNEYMKEIRENGYSDRFLELADQGLKMCSSTDHDFVYQKDFALYGAEAYILREEYDKALEYLNKVDINSIKKKDLSFLDGGQGLAVFFAIQMEYCNQTKDVERARRVYNDAIGYIDDFYGKGDDMDLFIDDFYCYYNYLNGDYVQAKRHAEKIIDNNLHKKSKMIGGHLHLASIYKKLGDQEKVDELLDEAEKLLEESDSAISKQVYEIQKKRLQETDE